MDVINHSEGYDSAVDTFASEETHPIDLLLLLLV